MIKKQSWGVAIALVLALAIGILVGPLITDVDWHRQLDSWLVANDDDDDHDDDDDVAIAPMTVVLDETAQHLAGIKTINVEPSRFYPENRARATVISIQPMLNQQAELRQLRAAYDVAKVRAESTKQELNRLQRLVKATGSIANKDVLAAEAAWQEAKAAQNQAQVQISNAEHTIRQQWETNMADWIFNPQDNDFKSLVERTDSLLLVTMPVGQPLQADVNVIRVAPEGDRSQARKAHYIAPAISVDSSLQGETHYFRVNTGRLRAGMRLDAWVPESQEPVTGVMIPDDSIIWYAGQPWAYTEIDEGLYQRVSLQHTLPAAEGLFDEQGLINPGDLLVVDGAQTLLSEEFKWQIVEEDDDDD
ncbi:hypothetical protein [Methylophaga sp. OBS3]|uniref:hypothetical protein n=1 Tax=Methylophaga sp. OBS3 TaxID=2991934 RepID=UPI002258600F|nr:hypothetical protein [Methylophaga sp. OBS3]MCX4190448.1 hypothetical protein [Methylophaga sp. OBS3]